MDSEDEERRKKIINPVTESRGVTMPMQKVVVDMWPFRRYCPT